MIANHRIKDGEEMGLNQIEDLVEAFREAGADKIVFSIGYNQQQYFVNLDGIKKQKIK